VVRELTAARGCSLTSPATSPASGRLLPNSTGPDNTVSAIESWLEDCLKSHDGCARSAFSADVSGRTGARFLKIEEDRLLLLQDISPAQYVCLSHCWGGGEGILRTTDSNFIDHSNGGIPMGSLPATFKDAVTICRLLKVSYLWIDSLCIIQDSDEDWRSQSATMADIYANAFLTIAASDSENATKGLFRTADPDFRGKPLPGHSGVYVRPLKDSGITWPLLKRAWVFQELVLSPRVVHFGPNEIIWQCRRAVKSQGRKREEVISTSIHDLNMISRAKEKLQSKDSNLTAIWHEMVRLYSQRRLTYSKDRLPAIAAIAKTMQSLRPGDEYIAGIWRSTLFFDMLWRTRFGQAEWTEGLLAAVKKRMAGSIPTWSWASISAGVEWGVADTVLSNVEILEVRYTVHGPTVSGAITEAAITLRCPLISFWDIRHRLDVPISLEEAINERISPGSNEMTHDNPQWDDVGLAPCHDIQARLCLLFLALKQGPSIWPGDRQRALIVMEKDRPDHYVRLGIVDVHYAGWWAITLRPGDPGYVEGYHVDGLTEKYNDRLKEMLEEMDTEIVTLL